LQQAIIPPIIGVIFRYEVCMKVLVTGATGFIGQHVVRWLTAENITVRAVVRNAASAPAMRLRGSGVEVVEGDLSQPPTLTGLATGMDTVVHTAGLVGSGRGSSKAYHTANVEGTRALLIEAQRAQVGRFVHISTVGVYGLGALQRDVQETQSIKPVGSAYVQSKADAEKMVANSGLPNVILRPYWVTGGGDRFLIPQVAALLQAGRFTLIGSGQQQWSISAVENFGDAIALCAVHPRAPGHIYHVNDETAPVHEIVAIVAQALGLSEPTQRTALALAVLKNYLIYWSKPKYTVDLLFGLWKDATFSSAKIRQELGWKPRVPWRDSLRQGVLDWQKRQS
jgi:2-alkyl-3-oxoalkanoate reductase